MRILTLTNLYPNPWQPDRAPFNRHQLRLLATHHSVRVIAPILWTDELVARWRRKERLPPGRRVVLDGLTVDHPRYWYVSKAFRGWYGHFFRWSVQSAFEQALREFQPDLVYAPWAYPDGWVAVELGHRAVLPVVIKVHGSDILRLAHFASRRDKTVEALRGAEGVVAVSQDLARGVVRMGVDPQRVRVIYGGVDAEHFHPSCQQQARARLGLDPDEPIVLFIGNLVPVKGLEVLVEACAQLAADRVSFACYIIGRGPLQSQVERRVQRRRLEGQIHLFGPQPHSALPDWYRAANVLVLPSYSEGVPNVLLEAAACGTPFVASEVGGIPEIAHLGVSQLVAPGDIDGFAQAMAVYLASPCTAEEPATSEIRDHSDAVAELSEFLEFVYHASDRSPAAGCSLQA